MAAPGRMLMNRVMVIPVCACLLSVCSCRQAPAPYSDFIHNNSSFSRPVSEDALKRQFLERSVLHPSPLPMDANALRAALLEGLNIGFMTSGLDSRRLRVREAGDSDRGGYVRRRLFLSDPFIGEMEACLLMPPRRAGPAPAVLVLLGHGDNVLDFENEHLGADLARAGYTVLIPVFRVYSLDLPERDLSLRLLRGGFTLMGIRVYETLLALKYLRGLREVDPSRVGIMGHSGGSAVANLAVRLSDGVAAQVSDYRVAYLAANDGTENAEHIPAIFPLSGTINNIATLPFPHLTVPYGFQDAVSRKHIMEFFSASLLHQGPLPADIEQPAENHFVKAQIAAAAGRQKAALASLEKAVSLNPGTGDILRISGLYADLGEFSKAEVLLKKTGKLSEDPELLIGSAFIAARAGNRSLALTRLSGAERITKQAEHRQQIAITYQELKEYGRALGLLRRLAAENPGKAVFLADLGLCEYLSGDSAAAEKHLRAAIELDQAFLSAYLTLGGIYSAGGRFQPALELYDKALALNPPGGGALLAAISQRRKSIPHSPPAVKR